MSLWTRSITGRLSLVVDQNCFITVIGEAHRKMTFGKESWRPDPTNDVTVFLQALEKRGPDSRHPAQQIGLENAGLSGL
jgi:hypothetical protein